MANDSIKEVIRDFVNFDIENNYYQKEQKEELVRQFKQILFEDDTTVRQFLKSFFEQTKNLADEYSLISKDLEAIEVPDETEEELEEPEDSEEIEPTEEQPETAEESLKKFYRTAAANILYE